MNVGDTVKFYTRANNNLTEEGFISRLTENLALINFIDDEECVWFTQDYLNSGGRTNVRIEIIPQSKDWSNLL